MLAIYCRTSKNKEKGKDYSIESQQQGGLKLAAALDISYKFYIDEGISGALDMEVRPGFAEMMSGIKKGKIQAVYCIDQSRIERNTDTWRFFAGECVNGKCRYYPNGVELDLNDTESMLFANLLSLINSYYSAITSRKVKIANNNKTKKGKTHGLKAYGYKRDENNNYVIFEDEAKYVRTMFELSLQGIGTYTIANIFNQEGIPTKYNRFEGVITRIDKYTKRESFYQKNNVKWRGNVIYDMLCNEIYKGIRVWKDIRVQVPAIVTEDLWNQVNDNLSMNKKFVGKKAKYHYLLNGLLFCPYCKNEIIGKKRLKGNDNAYKCKGKRPPLKTCKESRGISLPKLETFIIQHLFYDRELKELLSKAPKKGNEILHLKEGLEVKKNERGKLCKRLEKLAKLLKDPDLKEDENFILDYKDCKLKIENLQPEIENLSTRIIELENGDRNERTKKLIEKYTEEVAFDEVKRLVHSLIEKIEICHFKEKNKSYFIIKINYKNYDEYSVFLTDSKAMNWYWQYFYRGEIKNEEDLKEDRGQMKYMIEYFGKNTNDYIEELNNHRGRQAMSTMTGIIRLKPNALIRFDCTT